MMKKITLCADDYGQNPSISQAIITLIKKNRLSATSCLTTSSFWLEHANWLQPLVGCVDVGLHFNLTEGKLLSNALDSNGFLSLTKLLFKAYGGGLDSTAIEAELHAQLDVFEAAMGCMPHFINGHQHIHQLPVVRHALLKIYEKRLRAAGCYVRCVHDPRSYCRIRSRHYIKGLIIQSLGAAAFKKMLIRHQIPHNSSFAGIYSFAEAARYSRIFPHFLAQINDGGIIMCHPGLLSRENDMIAEARHYEFLYLESNDFVADCFQAGVMLERLSLS